jgi:hypothetical protein
MASILALAADLPTMELVKMSGQDEKSETGTDHLRNLCLQLPLIPARPIPKWLVAPLTLPINDATRRIG